MCWLSLMSPFLTWICDPAPPRATLAPAAATLRGVTILATTSFPCFSSKSIAMVPSLLWMSRETAARYPSASMRIRFAESPRVWRIS